MITFQFYTRRGCHLCEIMLEELLSMIRDKAEIELCDVDQNADWLRAYDIRVPVVEYEGKVISEYPLDSASIRQILAVPDGGNRE